MRSSDPPWVQSLRPRTGVENRVPEFIEEALAAEAMPEGLTGVLMRVPQSAGEQLAIRLARSGRRTERENIVQLAKACGGGCARHLKEMLKSAPTAKAAVAVGLLSRLDTAAVEDLLPERLQHSGRSFHDAVVRQLSIAGAPERGRLLTDSLELLDPFVLPLALDEIGMCGDVDTAPKLLRLAAGEILPQGSDYLRVKAIEALGRMRAPAAAGHLRLFVESRKAFGWLYPEEIRTAAAQALQKLDPEWINGFLPQSGLDGKVLALAPLDPGAGARRGAPPALPANPAAAQCAGGDHVGAREECVRHQRAEPGGRAAERREPTGGGNGSHAEDSGGPAFDQHAGGGALRAAASSWFRNGGHGTGRPRQAAAFAGVARRRGRLENVK